MDINLEYYKTFYYVARYGSLTAAAKILKSNQPNVTRIIHKLEAALGCRLFERTNHGVSLTAEGEQLLKHVEIAVTEIQQGESELSGSLRLTEGRINIGCTETALHLVFLKKLTVFNKSYPGIRVHLSCPTTPPALAALSRGLLDMAIVTSPAHIDQTMKQTVLLDYPETLIAAKDFPDLPKEALSIKKLSSYPLIMPDKSSMTYEHYKRLFNKAGTDLNPIAEAASVDQILPLVKSGIGFGIVPTEMVRDALKSGEIVEVPLLKQFPLRQVLLVTDQRRGLSLAAREMEHIILGE